MSACACKRAHRPAPRGGAAGYDDHHIIPRAWQRAWRPLTHAAPPGTPDDVDLGLWHPETLELAPTCHRNVHIALAGMMRLAAKIGHELTPNPPDAALVERAGHALVGRFGPEERLALLAAQSWEEAGGEVGYLLEHKLWGIG